MASTAVHSHDDHDHDEDHDEGSGMQTIMKLKIAMIVILFCVVYLGLIPAYSKYFRSSKVILSLMNCFAGGVFLAMALIHILPEAAEQYNDTMKEMAEAEELKASNSTASAAKVDEHDDHGHHFFPLPYLLFFVGYLMVLLIDRVLAGEHGHSHSHNQPDHGEHDHKHTHEEKEIPESERKLGESPNQIKDGPQTIQPVPLVIQDIENDYDQKENKEPIERGPIIKGDKDQQVNVHFQDNQVSDENAVIHGKSLEKEVLVCGVNISPLILLMALGFHSIFEGIALGMMKQVPKFINLMIGVTIHHAVACISLGVQFGQHNTKSKKAIFFVFFFLSLIESTGIGIGIGIQSAPDLVNSIILSLAGGTFIYIACSEILIHEFNDPKHRYWKFLLCIIGAATITLLWLLHTEE